MPETPTTAIAFDLPTLRHHGREGSGLRVRRHLRPPLKCQAAAAATRYPPAVGRIAACARVAYSKREALTCQIGKVSYIVEHMEVTRMAY